MKIKYLFLICISGALVTLDQLIKLRIHTSFHVGDSVSVIQDYFNITYVRNFGAAFGFLQDANPLFREIFFLSIPPIALVIILRALKSIDDSDKLQIVAFSMISGGAMGNYIDRLRFRYVIDFLDVHYKTIYYWPAFNLADSAIVCGVGLLLFATFFGKKTSQA